jgi:predicted dehydrogenase
MSQVEQGVPSRREFLKNSGQLAAAGVLAGVSLPAVHAGESNTIQLALIGCGGRGTGAVANALSTRSGPTRLVAMADVFPERLGASHRRIQQEFAQQVDVPEGRRFVGFDAYRRAMDCLGAGDVVILTTPPAFRWVHFTYAIQRGLNVFMEKPITVDGPTTRKMLRLAEESERRNLKVGVGLMCRHCAARQQLYDRIKQGQLGELLALRAYRMQGPSGLAGPRPEGLSELLYQIRRFHGFMWASGGLFMDFLIHNIDECCWMKDTWPIRAQGSGGRLYRGTSLDQNFDHYSIEYTFPDGTKLFVCGRNVPNCHQEFASYAEGTRGSAVISTRSHTPARCRIYLGHNATAADLVWHFPQPEPNPYQVEWDHLIEAIRQDRPYNEVRRGAEASLVTAMGRMAVHTGRIITREDIFQHPHEFAPGLDQLTMSSLAPLRLGSDGKYPLPQPGVTTQREF